MKHRNFELLKGIRKKNKSSRRVDNNPGWYKGGNGFVPLLRDRDPECFVWLSSVHAKRCRRSTFEQPCFDILCI